MSTNSSNFIYLQKPSANQCCNLAGGSNLGVSDPLDISKLGARPNRGKIRGQLKDYILLMLGAPVINIELDEQQLDAAVDISLQIIEEWAPREYFQYYVFNTIPGQSIYTMPPDVGYIRNVYYKETGTFSFQSSDLGGAIPTEYFYPGGAYASISGGLIDPVQPIWGRAGEWQLYKGYEQTYSRMASNIGGWEFYGGYQNVKIYPIPYRAHRVVVHYLQKNYDWGRVQQVMQDGALAHAKIMLGRIRSKIKNPPGPNGGVQLDGDTLLQEGREDRAKWLEDLINRFGDVLGPTLD
jgi:hypothetical protein